MAQMKEQIKTPEKELNEMEISNSSDAEIKTLVSFLHRDVKYSIGNGVAKELLHMSHGHE